MRAWARPQLQASSSRALGKSVLGSKLAVCCQTVQTQRTTVYLLSAIASDVFAVCRACKACRPKLAYSPSLSGEQSLALSPHATLKRLVGQDERPRGHFDKQASRRETSRACKRIPETEIFARSGIATRGPCRMPTSCCARGQELHAHTHQALGCSGSGVGASMGWWW